MRPIGLMIGIAIAAHASVGYAGVYTDDLTKCLVSKTSNSDQTLLMQWLFSALSVSPAVKDMASTTPTQRQEYNRKIAHLFQRLLFDDCHAEVVSALKYEGESAIQNSFQVLGAVASRGLMSDPSVAKEMQGLSANFDANKFKALMKEAGIPESSASPPK